MKRICDICGCEADEYWMVSFNIGSKTIWMCWGCYKQSQYEVLKSDYHRQKILYKLHDSKKVNK